MNRPFAQLRPVGPFVDQNNGSEASFVIEADTVDDVNEEAENIVTPTFDFMQDVRIEKVERLNDFKVIIDVSDYPLKSLAELRDSLDEAESRGVGIYDVEIAP